MNFLPSRSSAMTWLYCGKVCFIIIMIATILTKSSSFAAVDYNERKVSLGVAELIEMKNFGYLEGNGFPTVQALKDYLVSYSSKNENIKYPQFHVAISCKGNSHTQEELLDIAHKWLKGMGYGEEGQPLLVYAHHDTKNTHIHIITSRVAPDGHKIDHNNERVRSQQVLNEIMGINRSSQARTTKNKALEYTFATLGQYLSIMESLGYQVYKEDDSIKIKKDGKVQDEVDIKDIESHFVKMDKEKTKKRRQQIKAILLKYRNMSSNRRGLEASLRRMFGIDLVFHGKKDSPYGYTLIDHKNKIVYAGKDIVPLKELLQFNTAAKQSAKDIVDYIKKTMEENSGLSTYDMNKLLNSKYHAYIKANADFTNAKVVYRGEELELDQKVYEQLKKNGKYQWLQSFSPTTEEQKEILLRFGRIAEEDKDLIKVQPKGNRDRIEATLGQVELILSEKKDAIFDAFLASNMVLYRKDDKFFVVDKKNKIIVDLQAENIDLTSILEHKPHQHYINARNVGKQENNGKQVTAPSASMNQIMTATGSHGTNREWEINSGRWDDIDDERTLKRR